MNPKPNERTSRIDFVHVGLTKEEVNCALNYALQVKRERELRDAEPLPQDLVETGSFAEQAMMKKYNLSRLIPYSPDCDFIFPNGTKVDSKAKYVNKINPYGDHQNEIYLRGIDQETDYYVFSQVCKNTNTVCIVGYISKEEFLKYNDFVKSGELKPGELFGKAAKYDCYCLQCKYLKPMKYFLTEVNSKI